MMDSYKTFLFGQDNAGKTSLSETVKKGKSTMDSIIKKNIENIKKELLGI